MVAKSKTNKQKTNNPHFPLFVVSVEHFPGGFMGSVASLRSYWRKYQDLIVNYILIIQDNNLSLTSRYPVSLPFHSRAHLVQKHQDVDG